MNRVKIKTISVHPKRRLLWVSLGILAITAFVLSLISTIAIAAPILLVDDAGPDDEPGQKDLNFLTIDYETIAPDIAVTWGWDDTKWSGNNTGDACTLFDTDSDGFANYSLCITVDQAGSYLDTRLYSCDADSRSDRCGGPTDIPTFSSVGSASIQAVDPFGTSGRVNNDCSSVVAGACLTNDTVAELTVDIDDVGSGSAKLINVCSYPSQEPNSDPSDCVITPNAGFLTIVKIANPNDGTAFEFNASEPSAETPPVNSWTINGSGSVPLISYLSTTTLDLSEAVPTGWQLDSASCEIAGNGATGTFNGSTITNLEIRSGLETTCTFTNSLALGTLTLVKVVDNLGESGTGYLGVGDFPLTIDSVSTTSGTPVSVTPGDHAIAETPQSGYSVGTWTCDDGTSGTAGSSTATVNVSSGEDVTCTMTNTLIATPALELVKSATPSTYDSVGDVISYSYVMTNTGNVTLIAPFTITDDKSTDESCPSTPTSLAPGESITCSASYTISQPNLDAGSVTNIAQGHGYYGTTPVHSNFDDETVTAVQNPLISIVKTGAWVDGNGDGYAQPGELINYNFLVTNEGNVTLHDVTVTDPLPGMSAISCPKTTLAVGETMTCTANYAVKQADIDAGKVDNTATVNGKGPQDQPVSDTDDETVVLPRLFKVFLPMVGNNFGCKVLTTFGLTIGYEDLPVSQPNDYDYNDWITDIEGELNLTSFPTCGLQKIELTITPQARGASYDHKFRLVFPAGAFQSNGTATLTYYDQNGVLIGSLTKVSAFDAGLGKDFTIFEKTSDVLSAKSNTIQGGIKEDPKRTAKLSIVFDTPKEFILNFEDLISPRGEGLFFDPNLDVYNSVYTIVDNVNREDSRLLVVPEAEYLWPEEKTAIYNVYTGVSNTLVFQTDWWLLPHNDCVYDDKPCVLP